MKVAFLCTNEVSNQIFINTFKKFNLDLLVCIENNKLIKKKLIKKKLKKLNYFERLLFPLDVLALLIYRKNVKKYIKTKLNIVNNSLYLEENFLVTNDINNEQTFKNISNFKPDLIIVRGTSIIKKPLINYGAKYFLNIHGGVVPNYRNVHAQFWSYYFDDFYNMGSSILHITEGIDNGNIALMSCIDKRPINLKDLNLKVLQQSNKLISELINKLLAGQELDSIEQDKNIEPFYGPTPKFFNFLKILVK